MQINNIIIDTDLIDVLYKLKDQINSSLLKDIKDSGNNIMITCPYHKDGQERKPSAGIRKSDGTFHCFTCGETHSLCEVISQCFGINDLGVFGYNWLLKNFKSFDIENRKEIKLDVDRNNSNWNISNTDEFISELELDSYRYYHPYMYERKLTNEVIEMFDIGYDINTNCITFPVRDVNGNCLFIARRSVSSKYFHYPNSAKKPIYGLYEINQMVRKPSEILICESMLDALSSWGWGKPAVALNGLGTEYQYQQLRDMNCRKFILATDNDEAGLKARERLRKELKNKIITEYLFPSNIKDINEMTKEIFDNLEEIF